MSGTARVLQPRYGGACTVRFDRDQTIAEIPFVLPGELIEAGEALAGRKGSPPTAELLRILEPSADRTAARCRHFGVCGGCDYQHASQQAQLALKRGVLLSILSEAGVVAPEITVHAAEPWQYRNRVRFHVEGDTFGYRQRRSDRMLAIEECPIASPLLWHAMEKMLDLVQKGQARWPAGLTEVELFADADQSVLQVALHLDRSVRTVDRDAPAQFRHLCEIWRTNIPELRGAGLLVAADAVAGLGKRVQESRRVEIARWGQSGLVYRVGERSYEVTRNAFFQVNRFLTGRMIELVCGDRSGDRALDLFAGAGLFSLPLAERFGEVVAVEVSEPAATDLARALASRPGRHRAVQQSVTDFLCAYHLAAPDLIVMDPPRAGLGKPAVSELVRIGASDLVYVSCDPTTFARDARSLLKSGYALEHLHLLDLFPQTFHLETIAVFRR